MRIAEGLCSLVGIEAALTKSNVLDLAHTPGVLTTPQLRVFELREVHGCTWNQIAWMTDRHQATVRGHYNAAVRRLHAHIERTVT